MFIKCFSHNISWQSVKATKSVKVNGKTTYEYIRDDNRYSFLSYFFFFLFFDVLTDEHIMLSQLLYKYVSLTLI